jgi:hypothetical protein
MHTLEAAQEPILSAVAHEAAGPAVARDETSNPALIFVDRVVGTSVEASVVIGRMDEGMSHLILLAVPLFVFLGLLIEMTGMARAMVGFLASLLGHVRGGLSYVLDRLHKGAGRFNSGFARSLTSSRP